MMIKLPKVKKIIDTVVKIARAIPGHIKRIPVYIKILFSALRYYLMFLFMFSLYIANIPTIFLIKSQHTPNFLRMLTMRINVSISKIVSKYDTAKLSRMGWFDLFDLAFRNMAFKKTRSVITVGGMALGIGAIVFLVSLGYGVQNLVITRVARLEEMKQVDVATQPGSKNKITDKSVQDFKSQEHVEEALPLVGVAAKVKFEGSVTDVAVYGVSTEYLERSAIKPAEGHLFESRGDISVNTHSIENKGSSEESGDPYEQKIADYGEVSGSVAIKTNYSKGNKIGDIEYTIFPNSWLRVRKTPSTSSEIIGYTRRVVGTQFGEEFWGDEYVPAEYGRIVQSASGEWMGKWVKSLVPVWSDAPCDSQDPYCEEGRYYPVKDESGNQLYTVGYIAELEIMINKVISLADETYGSVLGVETMRFVLGDSAPGDSLVTEEGAGTASSTEEGEGEAGEAAALENLSDEEYIEKMYESPEALTSKQVVTMSLPESAQREAVVNTAFLRVLGFNDSGSTGSKFNVSFVLTGNLLDSNEKVESDFTEYKIVGVIPGDDAPFFYVPLNDMRYLGVKNYSQVKVVASSPDRLQDVRQKIESGGFVTSSVADTVAQINKLFATVRIILALLGGVALGVASLGMFNTLTVSLLERTREVGLMKAMGMTTDEVKRLFLTESILMGFTGGMIGIALGFAAGKIISILLSIMGIAKGAGIIDITRIPPTFLVLIFFLSLTVGLITGIYPSKRATKISALDALRYE